MILSGANPILAGRLAQSGVAALLLCGWAGFTDAHAAPAAPDKPSLRHTATVLCENQYRRTRHPFSPVPVTTTDALVKLVRTNARVRRLYARHFGVSEARVTDFMANALSLQRIPRSRRVTNYCARPDGTIYAVKTQLRAGELVWATRTGLPIFKWVCSNPLTKRLPGTQVPQAMIAKALPSPQKGTIPREPASDEPVDSATGLALAPEETGAMSSSNVMEAMPVVIPDSPATLKTAQGLSGIGMGTVSLRTASTSLTGTVPMTGTGSLSNLKVAQISLPTATVVGMMPMLEPREQKNALVPGGRRDPPLVDAMPLPEPGPHLLVGSVFPTLLYLLRRPNKRHA